MYQQKQGYNGIKKIIGSSESTIPNDPTSPEWREYQAWLAAGNTPLPDPEFTPDKVKARRLDDIRNAGVSMLDDAGYQAHKQTQMTVFVMGEVIKATKATVAALKATIAKTAVIVDTSAIDLVIVELDTVLAAIPYLTDLTFPQVVAMAGEIGKIRGAVNAVEAQMAALPLTATVNDVEAVAATPIAKPKNRRDIEAGK